MVNEESKSETRQSEKQLPTVPTRGEIGSKGSCDPEAGEVGSLPFNSRVDVRNVVVRVCVQAEGGAAA